MLKIVICFTVFISSSTTFAFQRKSLGLGFGYYSQNFLNKVANKETGQTGLMGTTHYLLNLNYASPLSGDWYWSPELGYSILPRTAADSAGKTTVTRLNLHFGKNINNDWDWYVGPGYMRYDFKGEGGNLVLNNGTSTSTFAKPGRSTVIQKITSNVGTSYTYDKSRFAIDLIIENLFSSNKRTQSMMLSYSYQFDGGF